MSDTTEAGQNVNPDVKMKGLKAPEGLLEDDTIFVTAQNCKLRLDGGRIQVNDRDDKKVGDFPVESITTVNLFGNVSMSTPLIHQCSKNGISVNYFSYYGKYVGSFVPLKNTIALVKRHQCSISSEKALLISKEIIRAKIQNFLRSF